MIIQKQSKKINSQWLAQKVALLFAKSLLLDDVPGYVVQ